MVNGCLLNKRESLRKDIHLGVFSVNNVRDAESVGEV
jgi:hypothetical protein